MKKTLILALTLCLLTAICAPIAVAEPSNVEKGIGNVLCTPFRIVGVPLVALGKLVQGKPAAVLTAPRDVRREVFDGIESAVRIPFAPAIDKNSGDMGAANTAIAEAKMDPVVDAVFYGAILGPVMWNNSGPFTNLLIKQTWTAAGSTAVGVGILDLGGAAAAAAEK